jgi:anionic cell wall polymer biosynthesis LytR-Cps2A-Psr (LCP) family protein
VCLTEENGGQNLQDANSGFNAVADGYNLSKGGSQYLHLDAAQSLAFVRERDNLTNGDLDRTHRQQAVVDYVLWKLKHQGTLTDLGQLGSLLSVARTYLVTDSGWNLLDFLPELNALSGDNLTFKTLPIVGYQTIDGQSANVVDVKAIKHAVHQAFYPSPKPASHSGKQSGHASGTASASPSTQSSGGASAQSVSASLDGASATPTSTAGSASPTETSTGPAGGTVSVNANAPYGIPCVN